MKKVTFFFSMIAVTAAFVSCSKDDKVSFPKAELFVPQYVDLGLSVKWATCNVGATSPEGYGDYFAWGATEPWYQAGYAQSKSPVWKDGRSDGYAWVNAPYQTVNTTDGAKIRCTKYLGSTTSIFKDASATDADALKTVLDLCDDAARANWGGDWRMPTKAEFEELLNTDNCTWTWYTTDSIGFGGIAGYKVTSKVTGYEGNWIFIPAAGSRYDKSLSFVGSCGCYCSSSLAFEWDDPGWQWGLYIDSVSHETIAEYQRCKGFSVRPVIK